MIKTYIIKIQSRNLIHDQRLLAVPKISFQMIPKKNKKQPVKNDPGSDSNFLNLNLKYHIVRFEFKLFVKQCHPRKYILIGIPIAIEWNVSK